MLRQSSKQKWDALSTKKENMEQWQTFLPLAVRLIYSKNASIPNPGGHALQATPTWITNLVLEKNKSMIGFKICFTCNINPLENIDRCRGNCFGRAIPPASSPDEYKVLPDQLWDIILAGKNQRLPWGFLPVEHKISSIVMEIVQSAFLPNTHTTINDSYSELLRIYKKENGN